MRKQRLKFHDLLKVAQLQIAELGFEPEWSRYQAPFLGECSSAAHSISNELSMGIVLFVSYYALALKFEILNINFCM